MFTYLRPIFRDEEVDHQGTIYDILRRQIIFRTRKHHLVRRREINVQKRREHEKLCLKTENEVN